MKKSDVPALLERLGFPFAYNHFAEGEGPARPSWCTAIPRPTTSPPMGWPTSSRISSTSRSTLIRKDPALEEQIEAALDESGIFYGKGETWIDSEKLYEVLYEMEVSA